MRGDFENFESLGNARKLLDQSVEQLPPEVVSALQKGRIKALELAESKEKRFWAIPGWVTAGGFASIAILVVAISLWISPFDNKLPVAQDDDLDIVAIDGQLDLYEDLDFFVWLSEKENAR